MKKTATLSGTGVLIMVLSFSLDRLTDGNGIDFFYQVMGLIGLGFFGYGFLYWPFQGERGQKTSRYLRKMVQVGLICWGISFLFIEGLILSERDSQPFEGDYLIVLGAGLYGDVPSLILISRLEVALDYLKAHPESRAILSGGQGEGESITEAEAMARYLIKAGIEKERLYLEQTSRNTRENLANSQMILLELGVDQGEVVAIISNDFHLYRAKKMAKQNGLLVVGLSAEVPNIPFLAINMYLREYFAVGKMVLQDHKIIW